MSQSFRDELVAEHGSITFHSVPELRRLPPTQMIQRLRSHRGERCLLPLEDPTSRPLAPLLGGVALLASPREIAIVARDGTLTRTRKRDAILSVISSAIASLDGRRALRRAKHDLATLARAERIDARVEEIHDVIYLNTNLWFGVTAGGSVGHIAGVVNGLADRGVDVTLATITPPPLLRGSVRVVPLQPPRTYGLPVEVNYLRFQHDVSPQVQRALPSAPSFIYQRLSVENYAGAILSRHLRIPLILEYNGSEAWAARHWGDTPLRYEDIALAAEDVLLRHAHLCVTVSDVLRDELQSRGVAPERIVTYPNGVDPTVYDPALFDERARTEVRRRYGIEPDALVIGFIGTFGQWHGTERLAAAARILVDEHIDWLRQKRVRFMLVGDGLRAREVRNLVGRPPYDAFVTLTGLVPQTEGPAHLAAADILVSPHVSNDDGSAFFGSPTKLFEYMAMGRPIIASDLNQIGEVLRAGGAPAALLVPPGDIAALVAALQQLVDDPALRERLGESARASALARFTWNRHVDEILSAVSTVLAQPAG